VGYAQTSGKREAERGKHSQDWRSTEARRNIGGKVAAGRAGGFVSYHVYKHKYRKKRRKEIKEQKIKKICRLHLHLVPGMSVMCLPPTIPLVSPTRRKVDSITGQGFL
jgi:hypothetical protein